jgi:transcriptional regulator with XRE-family HTH domain
MDKSVFATNLKKAMKEHDFNQKQLADMVGVPKTSMSGYVAGRNLPRQSVIRKLEEVLQCDLAATDHVEEVPVSELRKISTATVAMMLGTSDVFVRMALQKGSAPFGFAVKHSSKWSYHISPHLLKKYVGEEIFSKYVK